MSLDHIMNSSYEKPTPENIREDFLAFNDTIKTEFGEDSQTKAQVAGSMGLYLRDPYFNTAGYTSEPEPDIYVSQTEFSLEDQVLPFDQDLESENKIKADAEAWLEDAMNSGQIDPDNEFSDVDVRDVLDFDTPLSGHAQPEAVEAYNPVSNLNNARNELAGLSVKLRGKNINRKQLRAKYEAALNNYKTAYIAVNNEGVTSLLIDGHDNDTISGLFAYANASEHDLFTQAERDAYREQNPRLSKVADFWADKGMIKRAVMGAGGGMAFATLATGALAATGVGLIGLGVTGLSVKAARSIGMYKLNKGSRTVKEFDKKAAQDRRSASSTNANSYSFDMNAATTVASFSLIDTLNKRVESDQKQNRNRLYIALGAVAAGALIGTGIHALTHREGIGSRLLKDRHLNSVKPTAAPTTSIVEQAPVTTVPHVTSTLPVQSTTATTIPEVTHPTLTPTVGHPRPMNHDYGSQKPPVRAPITPAETPVAAPGVPIEAPVTVPQSLPEIDATQLTWTVAHEISSGNEGRLIQNAITHFNTLNNSNYALTPHNGSTWIIDNGRSINPAQMFELNRLMLQDELQTTGV